MGNPFYFQWHITDVCNLRCKHCYQNSFSIKTELDWYGLKTVCNNIIDALRTWNKKALITLTGGEPFMKRELNQLLNYLNSTEEVKELNIISNITLLNYKIINELKKYKKLKKIKFSLEGVTRESNDTVRGEGSFRKIIENLRLLQNNSKFEIILMFTLLKSNLDEIPKVFSFCKEYNLDGFILERFIPLGQGKLIRNEVLSKEDWKSLVELLIDFCQVPQHIDEIKNFKAFWIKFHPKTRKLMLLVAPCTVGVDGVCIMPNGDVLPCRRFNYVIGNLLEDDLTNIWEHSDVLFAIRKKYNLKGKCSVCSDQDCRGCRALAYALTNDYLEEDTQCWYED
jgi:radical SAM protein with 4Fe4S-binding SPASM domain